MRSAALVAPLVLAVVLAVAAIAKVRSPGSALSAMRLLRLPQPLLKPGLATAFPYAELVLAALLVVTPAGPAYVVVAAASLLLMVTYWALVARGLTMNPRPSCGCFGRLGSTIGPRTLARNTLFVALAAVTLWMAVAGSSPWRIVADAAAGDWWWVLAATAAAAAGWFVGNDQGAAPAVSQPHPTPAPHDEVRSEGDDDELEYLRQVIPEHVLVDTDGTPVTLRQLAMPKAQLLLWITCGCGRSHHVVDQVAQWREEMPEIDIRLVTTMALSGTDGFQITDENWLRDHQGLAFRDIGFTADPGALLLGADGLLAGGPVSSAEAVDEFVAEIKESLREIPLEHSQI